MDIVLEQKVKQLPRRTHQGVLDHVDFLLDKYHVRKLVKPCIVKCTITWMNEDFNAKLDDFKDYQ
jgi:hypothetical protein